MMKNVKLLLLTILISCVFAADGQDTLYHQDFENGIGGDMTIYDVDKLTAHPNAASPGSWVIDPGVYASSYAAVSTSWYVDPPGQSNDWLITPAIPITKGAKLQWIGLSYNPSFPDSYMVLMSNTDLQITSFQRIEVIDPENSEPTAREISLEEFEGDNVYIAFRNISDDKDLLVIDDILVTADETTSLTPVESTPHRLYPNPANEFVYVELEGEATIIVSNILGETVYTTSIKNTSKINLPSDWKGLYNFTLIQDNQRFTYPVVID